MPILLSQLVGLVCGLAGVRLVSAWVSPADFGAYGVFLTLAMVGSGVIYAGLVKFVSRHWEASQNRPALLREVGVTMMRKTVWLVLAAALAGIVVSRDDPLIYSALLFGGALAMGVLQIAQSALQAARENWADLGLASGVSLARSFAPPLLYLATGAGLVALLSGFLLHAAIGAAIGCWSLRQYWRGTENAAASRIVPVIYEGPRFVVTALAAWVLLGLNRWLVLWFFGAETAGYFTLAANIGAIMPTMLGAVLLQYFQPNWFALPTDGASARRGLLAAVDRVALLFTAVALLASAALHAGMPLLIGPLVDPRYAASAVFILGAGASASVLTTGNYYHAMLIAAKEEHACLRVDLAGAAGVALGTICSAAAGLPWFIGWLVISPLVPWLVNRPLARHALLQRTAG